MNSERMCVIAAMVTGVKMSLRGNTSVNTTVGFGHPHRSLHILLLVMQPIMSQ